MEEFLQQLTNGLAVGGIYALIALGYTMVYGVLRLINFAHGDLFTLGAYLGFTLLASFGLSGVIGGLAGAGLLVLMALIFVGLVGVLLERAAYRPLRNSDRLSAVVSALGASIFLQNAMMLLFGARPQVYPVRLLPTASFMLMGVEIPFTRVLLFSSSLVLMFLLYWFINRTRVGAAIRAVAIDQGAAKLVGIDVNRIISLVFLIGPALGGAAGVMVGMYYGQITHDMGLNYGLKALLPPFLGALATFPALCWGGCCWELLKPWAPPILPWAGKTPLPLSSSFSFLLCAPPAF